MHNIASHYWNMVHGATSEDEKKDLERLLTMRVLTRNMAWVLKCKEVGTSIRSIQLFQLFPTFCDSRIGPDTLNWWEANVLKKSSYLGR